MKKRPTQKQRILKVLEDANGDWVDLPVIMNPDDGPRIGQYNARILELRHDLRLYWEIRNRSYTINGEVWSQYCLHKCILLLTARQRQMKVLYDALGYPPDGPETTLPQPLNT